jgi:hypothetical protein
VGRLNPRLLDRGKSFFLAVMRQIVAYRDGVAGRESDQNLFYVHPQDARGL